MARIRRHGLVPPPARAGDRHPHPDLLARGVVGGRRVTDRAPPGDDPSVGGGLRGGRAAGPDPALVRDRGGGGPGRRPGAGDERLTARVALPVRGLGGAAASGVSGGGADGRGRGENAGASPRRALGEGLRAGGVRTAALALRAPWRAWPAAEPVLAVVRQLLRLGLSPDRVPDQEQGGGYRNL